MPRAAIFTDGACSGNPGPGGWGAIIDFEGEPRREMSGNEPRTTNNRMEIMAAIQALESLVDRAPVDVTLTTDSEYMVKGITQWIRGWKKRGWVTAARKPVLNRDLWERLDAITARHRVDWKWVRGHSGHPENERADQLAVEAIDRLARGDHDPGGAAPAGVGEGGGGGSGPLTRGEIVLMVGDLEAARGFYGEMLGLREEEASSRSATIAGAGLRLRIEKRPAGEKAFCAGMRLRLHAGSREALDAWREKLDEAGCDPKDRARGGLTVKDPDGRTVELLV